MAMMILGARLDEATQGHGLGLANTAVRARAYGGKIQLNESEGGGLLVQVRLPDENDHGFGRCQGIALAGRDPAHLTFAESIPGRHAGLERCVVNDRTVAASSSPSPFAHGSSGLNVRFRL
ncbi:hypothetical protein [Palleronia sp.]|uniref:hypothetical protein n=1 Tax=Palleronia sp. TaxID=1940284 RepID=UPI0035C820EE